MKVLVLLFITVAVGFAQPWQPNVIWQREGAGDSSRYGAAILALGDQNNDGFNDWAVWAQGRGFGGSTDDSGRVEFFHGAITPSQQPYMILRAPVGQHHFITYPQVIGDVNGDGYIDWEFWTNDPFNGNDPIVHNFYFGGPNATPEPNLVTTTPMFFSPISDFNGDGFDDLLATNGTATDIYYGGNPFDTLPDWHRSEYLTGSYGDLNGDGFSDIISDPTDAFLEIYLGDVFPDTLPTYVWATPPNTGYEVVGDINADGFEDLATGRPRATAFMWGASILDTTVDVLGSFPCGTQQDPDWPHSFYRAGDVNADGYDDAIALSQDCEGVGLLALQLGHPWIANQPELLIWGWSPPLNLPSIYTATGLGDINGDHVDDFAIGSFDDFIPAGWRGKVIIIAGDSVQHVAVDEQRAEIPDKLMVDIFPNPFNSSIEIRYELPKQERVKLSVYDILGREVVELVNGMQNAGEHQAQFEGKGLGSGIYFARMEMSSGQIGGSASARTLKMVMLK